MVRHKKNDWGLTEREMQVLTLYSQGLVDWEIAKELGISKRTVQVHACNAYRVLGVNNKVGALSELGLLKSGDKNAEQGILRERSYTQSNTEQDNEPRS